MESKLRDGEVTGKQLQRATDKQQAPEKGSEKSRQASIVDKVLKNKNRFRAGLGFREKRGAVEDKMRVAQNVSKKKILQGTKADKERKEEDDDVRDEPKGSKTQDDFTEFESGPRNRATHADVDEEVLVSASAKHKKQTYVDPRATMLAQIKLAEKQVSEKKAEAEPKE